MKVELVHYMHESNGICLRIIPEGEIELSLLSSLFTFGKMQVNAGSFYIQAFEAKKEKTNEKA